MSRSRGMTIFKNMILYFTKTNILLAILLLSTTGRSDSTDIGSQTFNEAVISSSASSSLNHRQKPRASSSTRSCWIGREVSASFDRPQFSSSSSPLSYITVCPSLRIQCHGRIANWRATMIVADRNPINFAVFRSTQDASGQRFTMIGYNTFLAGPLGRVVFEVPEPKRLAVKPGDIFGYFRMGPGQSEFIGFVNVETETINSTEKSPDRTQLITGNYDSCYQLQMTYIDLIKANYKITIDSNASLRKRLYSLAAVVEATANSSVNASAKSHHHKSPGRNRNHVRVSKLRSEVAARARLVQMKRKYTRKPIIGKIPPPPIVPFQRWRPYVTIATPITTSTPFLRRFYLNGPQLDHVPFSEPTRSPVRRRQKSANRNSINGTLKASPRQADDADKGLIWCGEPPTIENSYSVNEVLAQIRLPTRSYACQSGYTPVGYNRIFCDPSTRTWTPLNFQCVFTIIMEDEPTPKPITGVIPATIVITPPPEPPNADPTTANTCLFPPIIDNGYAIRQDEVTVVYRCYPGFLKIGQVDQDGSTCDRQTNVWTPPLVSCVLGRNTVTIPVIPPTTPILATREIFDMSELFATPATPWQNLPPILVPPVQPSQMQQPPLVLMRPQTTPAMLIFEPPINQATVTIPFDVDDNEPMTPPFTMPQQTSVQPPVPALFPVAPQGPTSNILDCGLPPRIANGRFYQDPDPYYPAKSYIYECYPGYVMHGQPVVFCNPYYGRFTQLTARCQPIGLETTTPSPTTLSTTWKPSSDNLPDCGVPPPIANAFTVTGGQKGSAVYLCLPGYVGVGVAEIRCLVPQPDDDPGQGPTWSSTNFNCVVSSQMSKQTTTTLEPTTEFQPFIIIPGPRRTTTRRTTIATTLGPNEVTKTQPWEWPTPKYYQQRPPLQVPNQQNSIELVTPPSDLRHVTNWQNFETLQPTKRPNSMVLPPLTTTTPAPSVTTWWTPWLTPAGLTQDSSNLEGVCQVFQTCGEPPVVTNAHTESSYSGRHSCPGDYVRYICEPGFRLESLISAVFCSQATYSWSPNKPPICIPNPNNSNSNM